MLLKHARSLRRDMTDAERKLWYKIRDRRLNGYKFKRQFPVWPYILDFACHDVLLAVEVDGGQHAENPNDFLRTQWLIKEGWTILRFWNNEVLDQTDYVVHTLSAKLKELDKTLSQKIRESLVPSPLR